MRKLHKILIVLLAYILLFSGLTFADATNGLTSPSELIDTDGVNLELEREAYYVFDSDPSAAWYDIDMDSKLANFFFGVLKYLTSATCYVITFAYTSSLFTLFDSLIQAVMMPMKKTIFDNFFSLTAIIVAVISIMMLERGKQHAFSRTAINVVAIYVISFMFFAAPLTALKYSEMVVDSLNNKFIQSSYSVTFKNALRGRYSDDAALTLLNNMIWEAFIGRIWTDLEIGEAALIETYKERIINAPPGSLEREQVYKELSDKRTVGRPSRGGPIFFYFIVVTPLLLLVCLLGGVGLAASVVVMLLILLSSVIFLISILPGRGMRILYIWTLKLLTFSSASFFGLVALTTVLSIHIGWIEYASNSGMAIGTALFLEALFMIVIFVCRHYIFGFGKSFRKYGAAGIERQFKKDPNLHRGVPTQVRKAGYRAVDATSSQLKTAGRYAGNYAKGTAGAAGRFMQQMHNEVISEDSSHMQYAYAFANHSMHTRNTAKEKTIHAYEHSKAQAHDYFEHRTMRKKMAGDYLDTRFQVEKAAADDVFDKKEEVSGKPVERNYPDFVKNALTREAAGMSKFSKAQLKDVSLEMDHIEKMGGDPRRMFKELKDIMKAQGATEGPRMQQTFTKMRYKQAMNKGDYDTSKGIVDIPKRATDREYGEIYLTNQYHMHKNSADNSAKAESRINDTTVKPRYDEFTRGVNERIANKGNKFTKQQLDAAEQTMKELREGGIKPKRFLNDMAMDDVDEALKDYMAVDLKVDRPESNISENTFVKGDESDHTPGEQASTLKTDKESSPVIEQTIHAEIKTDIPVSDWNEYKETKAHTTSEVHVHVNESANDNYTEVPKSIDMEELLKSMESLMLDIVKSERDPGKSATSKSTHQKINTTDKDRGPKAQNERFRNWSKQDKDEFATLLDSRMKEFSRYSKQELTNSEIMEDVHDKVTELEEQMREKERGEN